MDMGTCMDNFYGNTMTTGANAMPSTGDIVQQLGQGHAISHQSPGQITPKVQGHIGSNIYGCGQCLLKCDGKEGLRRHVLEVHGAQYIYICYECGKLFKSYQGYKKHEKFLHRDGGEYKKCDICGRNFPNDSSLKQHQLKHADSKPYTCDKCGRSYKYLNSLHYHTCMM
ncbi:Zinc finger protein 99 [Mizuhopecten yessoensis]|uniref:Zinc finger protein 99 n=2 Tax=Mizuhopecten yessoensis TaxID=6573 RepID=A0A210Q3P8_MIZYE|nr:Zinc finger protein 99 [Mizuhopecten yessoensis]